MITLKNPDKWWEEIHPWEENDPSHGHYFITITKTSWFHKGVIVKCIESDSVLDGGGTTRWEQVYPEVSSHPPGIWWLYNEDVRYWGPNINEADNLPQEPPDPLIRFKMILED